MRSLPLSKDTLGVLGSGFEFFSGGSIDHSVEKNRKTLQRL